VAVIACSDQAVDLPGLPGFAVALGGPLLWTDPSVVASSTTAELARLAPSRLILAGLEGSFAETAVAQLAQAASLSPSDVEFVSASDRSALAAMIAERVGVPPTGEVLVVDADNAAAKLAAAPISAARRIPLLLAEDGSLQPAAIEALATIQPRISRLVLVGPESGLPQSVSGGIPHARVDGIDGPHRVAVLNARYFKSTTAGATRPVVASYRSPSAYLVAATRAGRINQPLIAVGDRTLPAFTREWIVNRRSAIGGFTLIDNSAMPNLMDVMLTKADR
jgi:hypothetical protein